MARAGEIERIKGERMDRMDGGRENGGNGWTPMEGERMDGGMKAIDDKCMILTIEHHGSERE